MRTPRTSRIARVLRRQTGIRTNRFEILEDRRLLAWLAQIGGADTESVRQGTVDCDGSTYIVGSIFGTTDFDPGLGVFNRTASGDRDGYVAKYDASGNFAWARSFGGTGGALDSAWSIVADNGAVYVTGKSHPKSDFNGDGVADFAGKEMQVFILKLDSASGATQWVKGVTASEGRDISVADGHVYVTGDFIGTVDFNPGSAVNTLTATGRGKSGSLGRFRSQAQRRHGRIRARLEFRQHGDGVGPPRNDRRQ
jgi:hypothetical protein